MLLFAVANSNAQAIKEAQEIRVKQLYAVMREKGGEGFLGEALRHVNL